MSGVRDGAASRTGRDVPQPAAGERVIGVAVAIPEPYGSELQRWRSTFGDPLADAIPTHVTLLPPTVVPADGLGEVERHLLDVAARTEPFGVRLHGTATFRPVSPVVFVALAEGISSCEQLALAIRTGPLHRELAFPYHPHVTVAHDLPEESLDKAYRALDGYACAFNVHAFSLYEHGADRVWRPQRDFALGGPLPGPFPNGSGATASSDGASSDGASSDGAASDGALDGAPSSAGSDRIGLGRAWPG